MTAREELIEAMFSAYLKVAPWGDEGADTQQRAIGASLDALTPDLWLRYGLEMGWVEKKSYYACELEHRLTVNPNCDEPKECLHARVYRFKGAEKTHE